MNEIYKQVETLDLHDHLTNEAKKASVRGKAQEYINDTLPAFKAACPTEAKSITDLENGNYLKKLAAIREKRKRHFVILRQVPASPALRHDEDLEDLEVSGRGLRGNQYRTCNRADLRRIRMRPVKHVWSS